jgi:hypothetical protein
MTNTKKLFILLFVALYSVSAFAQLSSTTDDKQLDFLIGDWELFSNEGFLIGENKIELIGGTRTFEESYKGFDGFNTQSIFKYDVDNNRWLQDWSDEFGTSLQFEGKISNGKLTLNATSIDGKGNKTHHQVVYQKTSSGSLKHTWKQSNNLKNWETTLSGTYKRKKAML